MKKSLKLTTFGERLCFLRKKRGFTQQELAEKLNYKRSGSISRIENGFSPPDFQALPKIATVLEADLHWLLTGNLGPTFDIFLDEYCEATARALPYVGDHFTDLVQRRGDRRQAQEALRKAKESGDTDSLVKLEQTIADITKFDGWIADTTKDLVWFQRDAADILKSKMPLPDPDEADPDADTVSNGTG